ncbi:MAG: hypothetical protein FWD12_05210 [Alphaproteobacteria bacterium]|nr:hypothetical protein [Alphaproteobacteria bacterium]
MKRRIRKKKMARWSKDALKAYDLYLKSITTPLTPAEQRKRARHLRKAKKAQKGW